jgi:hypothetical protein
VVSHFVELYAMRIDPILPYLGLAGSPLVNMSDIRLLLIMFLIIQSAMLVDGCHALTLVDELVELGRLDLDDVFERSTIEDSMVGGVALQSLTVCASSGRESFHR